MTRVYVVAHGGAGLHSTNSEPDVKKALQNSCRQALSSASSASALSLVETTITCLEDSPLLNAGYGSNLTLDGTVECDAAIMDGQSDFGSVGSISGVKNPIQLARGILEHSRVPDHLGRIPPLTLVSAGAYAFARTINLALVPPECLIASHAHKQWATWKDRLATPSSSSAEDFAASTFQDTVGAVAWNATSGEIASGVSSGGILLKHPGRIGEAAVFGAGCWAQAAGGRRKHAMACSVSGAGEYIVKAGLARSIGDALDQDTVDVDVHEVLQHVLVNEFWMPSRSPSNPDPSAGVILLTSEEDDDGRPRGRLWCAFTTPSMAIAYGSSDNPLGKVRMLRRPREIEARSSDHPRVFVTGFAL